MIADPSIEWILATTISVFTVVPPSSRVLDDVPPDSVEGFGSADDVFPKPPLPHRIAAHDTLLPAPSRDGRLERSNNGAQGTRSKFSGRSAGFGRNRRAVDNDQTVTVLCGALGYVK